MSIAIISFVCALSAAIAGFVLGWGRYQGANWLDGKLKTEERDHG